MLKMACFVDGNGWALCLVALMLLTPSCTGTESLLKIDDDADFNQFGRSVGVSGNYAIVGAPYEDYHGLQSTGVAYFFELSDCKWAKTDRVVASDNEAYDYFGTDVDISFDTAVVGATGEDVPGSSSGAAYVFYKSSGGRWYQSTKLTWTGLRSGDNFGRSVAVSGDTIAVGVPYYDGTSGTKYSSGAVILYRRSSSGSVSFTFDAVLAPSGLTNYNYFGWSVDLTQGGNVAVVGARGQGTGAVYIFQRTAPATWTQRAIITCPDTLCGDFGYSVAASGNRVAVGDPRYSSNRGRVHVYLLTTSLTGSSIERVFYGTTTEQLGLSVSISGKNVVMGGPFNDYCPRKPLGATWSNCGRAIFRSGFGLFRYLYATNCAGNGDWFGYDVAISGNNIIVGAPTNDDAAVNAGTAYGYFVDPTCSSASGAMNAGGSSPSSPKSVDNTSTHAVSLSRDGLLVIGVSSAVIAFLCVCGCAGLAALRRGKIFGSEYEGAQMVNETELSLSTSLPEALATSSDQEEMDVDEDVTGIDRVEASLIV